MALRPDLLKATATPWLLLLSLLALTQSAHLLEHVAQMAQLHLLGLSGASARGIIGRLDIEWVHFAWNTWVLLALVALLPRFGANRWLLLTFALAGWHLVEHVVIMTTYLGTGVAGSPGLLGAGGLLGGGLPLARPDLHFLYNVLETLPLLAAWRLELRRA